jgi:hypothetical protein
MASWIGLCRPAVGQAATAPFFGEPVSRVDLDKPKAQKTLRANLESASKRCPSRTTQ